MYEFCMPFTCLQFKEWNIDHPTFFKLYDNPLNSFSRIFYVHFKHKFGVRVLHLQPPNAGYQCKTSQIE